MFGPDETTQPRQKVLLTRDSQRQITSIIRDGHKGKADLSLLGLDFPYCHPISLYQGLLGAMANDPNDIVIDYFAGSGTTGHAVLNLNKKDGGKRKFILIEMGEFFDSILKSRIVKVIYSNNWKNGKPQDNDGSNKQIVKYQTLEQYEDTLNNVLFSDKGGLAQTTLQKLPDYFLQHVLNVETKDSPTRLTIDRFKTPFEYKIKTLQGREEKTEPVDLVETFNYLLGIKVKNIRQYESEQTKYIIVYGEMGEESSATKVLVIWRNFDETILEKEKQFIEEKILPQFSPDTIYVNVDSLIRGAESIEPKFKELMGA
ncbi:MAG: DNA methyltransferase [Candidatus Hodarchaeota archaeon]